MAIEIDPTSARFALIELDDPPRAPVRTSSPEDLGLAHAAAYLGTSPGSMGATLYAPGTELMDIGKVTARGLRLDWESRPTVREAMDATIVTIAAEDRRDFTWSTSGLFVAGDGRINGLDFDPPAWRALMAKAPREAKLPGNVNTWLPQSKDTRVFRTRNPGPAGRDCFAVVSRKYQAMDLDQVAYHVKKAMPRDAHAEVKYDGARWQIDVSHSNPAMLTEAKVGTLHRLGTRITGADDGTASIKVKPYAERVHCVNCTIITDERYTLDRRHVGNGIDVLLSRALASAGEALASFGAIWREANERRIHDAYDGTPIGADETFRRLISHGFVTLPGEPAEALASLMDAWHREPGDTAAHVNMAMTRAAQSVDTWARGDLEEQAGELLYQRVYELDPLTVAQRDSFTA